MTPLLTPLTKITLGAAIAVALTTSRADAAPTNAKLFWVASQIRGEVAELQARAAGVLRYCDDADDVYEELADLCRDLDRFERAIARPIYHSHDLDRLARLAERIDDHACEVQEELADAIEDLEFPRRRTFHHGSPVHRPVYAKPVSRGFSLTIGRGGPRLVIGDRHPSHLVFHPGADQSVARPGPAFVDAHGPSPHEVKQLLSTADRLRYLTSQLRRALRV